MKLLYAPKKSRPMRVIVFASGSGGNLLAAIQAAQKYPELLSVNLVVTDRLGIKAIDIAKKYNIPVIASDFEKACGVWKDCKDDPKKRKVYFECAQKYHDKILAQIKNIEKSSGQKFDLVVLSYHRWIHGKLLSYFKDRIINQHAGDLSIMKEENSNERKYIGINPVLYALKNGEIRTRTSTFLVGEGHDTGEILCQGAWVTYTGKQPSTKESAWEHEVIQKKESDWPSLTFALLGIAKGEFGISSETTHHDNNRTIYFHGKPLPYGGVEIASYKE